MLVAVGSVKGSPGATTLAVALAALWPAGRAVVVEADCAGGDLGARLWLPDTPGLASLATAARAGSVAVADHVSRLPCGADAVLAPAGRQAATVAVGLLAEADPSVWAGQRPVILDVGRLDPGAPSTTLLDAADALLVTTGGDEGSLMRLAEAGLSSVPAFVVLVGGSAYPPSEITAVVGLPVCALLPWDARGVQVLWGQRTPGAGWSRRGLPAVVRALTHRLVPDRPDRDRPDRARPDRAHPGGGARAAADPADGWATIEARPAPGTPDDEAELPAGLIAWLRAGGALRDG